MPNYKPSEVDTLIENIQDKHQKKREKTVDELVKIFPHLDDSELQKKVGLILIAALSDDEWPVRKSAAAALPFYSQSWTAEPLAHALITHTDSAWSAGYNKAIGEALIKLGKHSVKPVIELFTEENRKIISKNTGSEHPISTLIYDTNGLIVRFGKEFAPLLISVLKIGSKNETAAVVFTLVEIGEPAIEPLIQTIKGGGVCSLAPFFTAPSYVPILRQEIGISEILIRGLGAASSMGKVGRQYLDELYLKDIEKRQQNDYGKLAVKTFYSVEADLCEFVKKMDPLMISLIAILKGPTTHYFEAIGKAFSLIGKQAIDVLLSDLENPDVGVQLKAENLLGYTNASLAVPALATMIEKGNLNYVILDSLVRLGDPRAVPPLIAALDNENVLIKGKAMETLGRLADSRAVEPLILYLEDKNPDICKTAIRALGQIGGNSALPSLIEQLSNTKGKFLFGLAGERICDVAAETLEKIGTPEALEAIEKWKTNKR